MSRLDHYDLLGVAKYASASEIRAAYLRLIKERHPDRSHGGDRAGPSPSEINAAYAVLRDPLLRARYDRVLRPRTPVYRLPPKHPSSAPRRRSRFGDMAAIALVVAALGLVAFAQQKLEEREKAWPSMALPPKGNDRLAIEAAAEGLAINESAVAEAAEAASISSAGSAAEHSRRCFGELAGSPTLMLLDYCLTFDASVALWHPHLTLPNSKMTYFTPPVQTARHAQALLHFFKDRQAASQRSLAIEGSSVGYLAEGLADRLRQSGSLNKRPEGAPHAPERKSRPANDQRNGSR